MKDETPVIRLPLANERILVFDPGMMTGIALFERGQLTACQTASEEEMIRACGKGQSDSFSDRTPVFKAVLLHAIVVERFTLYPGMALRMINSSFVSAQVIGMIRVLASYHLLNPVYQAASQAKNLVTDELLKTYDPHRLLKTKHERDAARHGVYFLNKLYRETR